MALKYDGIKGMSELISELKALPSRVQRNVLRTAIFRGAQEVRDIAKSNLRSVGAIRTGNLLKSIRAVRSKNTDTEVVAKVEFSQKRGWYAHLVEKGHALRKTTGFAPRGKNSKGFNNTTQGPATQIVKKKTSVGHVPARPFLVPALEQNRETIKSAILKGLSEEMQKQFAKLKKA